MDRLSFSFWRRGVEFRVAPDHRRTIGSLTLKIPYYKRHVCLLMPRNLPDAAAILWQRYGIRRNRHRRVVT